MRRNGVCTVEDSGNEKTGIVSTTYVSQNSCGSCPFKGRGCYGEGGHVGMVTIDLNKRAGDCLNEMELAREEEKQIDALSGKNNLRLHVVGDCASNPAAKRVSGACERYKARGKKDAWGYTHSALTVDRESWGSVSILASCETVSEILACHERGYACATVEGQDIEESLKAHGFRVVQCPAQTKDGVNCSNCRLCMMDTVLRRHKLVITFKAHGYRARMIKKIVADKRQSGE